MTQTERDWSDLAGAWIADLETAMDAAYAADDGPAYRVAAAWRDRIRSVRRQLDPTAEFRDNVRAASRSFDAFGRDMRRATDAVGDLARALEAAGRRP